LETGIFITGAGGYISQHLIKYLLDRSTPDLRFMMCDIKEGRDFASIKGAKFDAVVHLAAHSSVTQSLLDPDECLDNNALKLISFLTNNKIGKFIFTSTGGAIYGNRLNAKEEDASWKGCISPYGQSKFLAEKIIRRLHPNHTILRLGNVYGGDDSNRLELAMHARFKKDDPIIVYGGNQVRDFVHVDVVCESIFKAIHSDVTGTYNIGSGTGVQIRNIAWAIAKERQVPINFVPAREGEIDTVSLDISKAQQAGLL
jgi:UDP-glucose 4-epimerase